ncbi:MAG: OmpA family protein [Desulfobulbaceae bacterium]|nr:OmpA family protein [Desulfobulbaceae bacterium]
MRGRNALFFAAAILLVFSLGVTGCGKKKSKTVPEQPIAQTQVMEEAGAMTEPLESTGEAGIMEGRTSGPMVPVYFAFDRSSIDGDQVPRIETNADFLKNNSDIRIRVEGNCDPRGTKEYNLALGERRAQSAKNYLVNLGVDKERMTTISFGAEKLLLFGHDEMSWAQNRRADFVIVK